MHRMLLAVAAAFFVLSEASVGGVVKGTVYDAETAAPVPGVTIRAEGTGQSMVANQEGSYRFRLQAGAYQLRFSHVAYYSDTITVVVDDSTIVRDIKLRPSVHVIPGMKVYTRAYDPAQKIILEAIRRKDSLLSRLRSYSLETYTKLVMRQNKRPDSINVIFITETQLVSQWEEPDKRKNIIIARKQSANIKPDENLVAFAQLIDFNENRINLGQTPVVCPTAQDALDYYNYYLLDRFYIDSQLVYHLEIEPKNQFTPLFLGTIDIADSSFAVVGVDIGVNQAAEFPFARNFKYKQQYSQFPGNFWMPVQVHLSADLRIPFVNLPLSVEMTAAMHNYSINNSHPEGTFDRYVLEVGDSADIFDSTAWNQKQVIPLTEQELKNYWRIDSLDKVPPSVPAVLVQAGVGVLALGVLDYNFYHFNRVEGSYLGVHGSYGGLLPGLVLRGRTGWAFSGRYWQHNYGLNYTISQPVRLKIDMEFHDQIRFLPTVIAPDIGNPTLLALFDQSDPYDYYLEKGFKATVSTDVFSPRLSFSVGYNDFDQYSVLNHTDFSFFGGDRTVRGNPSVENGKLRSVSANLVWRTINLIKNKSRVEEISDYPYTAAGIRLEYASPRFIANDFDFRLYGVWLYHERRTLGLGNTDLLIYAGSSDGSLPPQKQYTVDFGSYGTLGFKTMGQHNFRGDQVLAGYIQHNFGRLIFAASGLPLVKKIPFSLSVYGGSFGTELRGRSQSDMAFAAMTAPRAYSEIGFAVGNLPLLKAELYFTWQLSHYPTNRFSMALGLWQLGRFGL